MWDGICLVVEIAVGLIASILDAAFQLITLPFRFIWENCKEYVFAAWDWIKNAVSTAINVVKDTITTVMEAISTFFVNVWNGIKSTFETVWNAIIDFLKPIIDAIRNFISEKFNAIKDAISTVINTIKNTITTVWNAIVNFLTPIINGIKEFISTAFNAIKDTASTVWNTIKNAVSTAVNAVKSAVSTAFNAVKTTVTDIFNSVKNTVSNIWNGVQTTISNVVNGIKTTISSGFNTAKSTVSSILDGIKTKFTSIFDNVKNVVKNAIDAIKGFFKFNVELPKIKLPHFGIKPAGWQIGDLLKGSIPSLSIQWYKKAYDNAMILSNPTIFGYSNGSLLGGGDGNGNEIVAGESYLLGLISQAVESKNEKIVALLSALLEATVGGNEEMVQALMADRTFAVGEREFARLVRTYPSDQTIKNALDLVEHLMQKYSIPKDNVIRHYDVSGKLCPVYWCGTKDKDTKWETAFLSRLGASSVTKKTVEQIAREVIQGKWGNGSERKKKLAAAGYDYTEVQSLVNKILGK